MAPHGRSTPSNIFNNGGNVGIGTATPGAALEVVGQVKITGGTPGAGKVLGSDASGLASWVAPTTIETDPQVGNLSLNSVPRWTGSSLENGSITDLGGSVNVMLTQGNSMNINNSYGGGLNLISGANGINMVANNGGPTYQAEMNLGTPGGYLGFLSPSTYGPDTSIIIRSGDLWVKNYTTNNIDIAIKRNGNVGIGTNTPAAKLDVIGNVKITDGTQGAGKLLTSDANGLATWQTVAMGLTSVGPIAGTANANGATITGSVLNLTPANATHGGVVTIGTQSFEGNKTFVKDLIVGGAITVGGGNSGLTYTTTASGTRCNGIQYCGMVWDGCRVSGTECQYEWIGKYGRRKMGAERQHYCKLQHSDGILYHEDQYIG
jgi:hypothetical protein